MGSSVSRIVKKVTKPIKKIASSPIGQIAMAAYLGPAAASSGFLSGMNPIVRNAILNAATQKLTTGDVDLKSAIASGAISGGIPQTGILSGIENPMLKSAATTALSNVGGSLVTGQKIDPKQIALASALSGGITGLQQSGKLPYYQQVQEKLGFQPTQPDTTGTGTRDISAIAGMEQTDTQLGIGQPAAPITETPEYSGSAGQGYDVDMGYEPTVKDVGGVKVTGPAPLGTPGTATDTTATTDSGTFTTKQAFDNFMQNKTPGNALDVLKTAVMNNKMITGITLASLASSAAMPKQPGESDEEYQKRLGEVENYVRRYGSNLNLPQEQINRILSNVRAESSGDIAYDFANGGRVMRNMGGPGNFSLGDLTRFIDVNPRDGIDDRDPMNGMGVRTMAMGGGIMGIPVRDNGMGVQELDYRQEGGFVPVGIKEKADDVPAMLSKNEFVMTADAVKGADPEGKGDVERGAQAMYDTMKRLESKIA